MLSVLKTTSENRESCPDLKNANYTIEKDNYVERKNMKINRTLLFSGLALTAYSSNKTDANSSLHVKKRQSRQSNF